MRLVHLFLISWMAVGVGFGRHSQSVSNTNVCQTGRFQIAFTSEYFDVSMPETTKIYVVNLDGSDLRRLTATGQYIHEIRPSWSPDGRHIVFDSNLARFSEGSTPESTPELYMIQVGENQLSRLTYDAANSSFPDWSPDGRLAFSNYEGIQILDLATREQTHLGEGFVPKWSPDGNKIAFRLHKGLGVMNADGSDYLKLTDIPAQYSNFNWSPDSTKLVFVSDRDGDDEIYRIMVDGSNLVRLTNNNFDEFSPGWSPDGKWIGFRDDENTLHIIDPNGSDAFKLRIPNPIVGFRWLPDGRGIVFFVAEDKLLRLHCLDLACVQSPKGCSLEDVIPIPNTETMGSYGIDFDISSKTG